jgi:hypothetical protein
VAVALLVPSPLLGAPSWEPTAVELGRRGVTAGIVHLTPPLDAPHPWWEHAAREVATAAAAIADDVVLVGHSGAGPRLPVFGHSVGEAAVGVAGYLFVDAGLPTPGRSAADLAPLEILELLDRLEDDDGILPPWCEWWGEGVLEGLVPDPVARHHLEAACWPVPRSLFDEVAPVPPHWPEAPCAYLQLTDSYDEDADQARARRWVVRRRRGTHLDPVTNPGALCDELLDVARAAGLALT